MASKKIEAAIKGSIANPDAAQAVIKALSMGASETVEPIEDPTIADAEEIATKVNELIAALQAAGLMK